MQKIICLILLSLLTACASSPYTYKGEMREISVDITSDIPINAVIYDADAPIGDTLNNRAFRQKLGILPLKSKIIVPKNLNLKLTPTGVSDRYPWIGEGLIITPTDVSIKHHVEFLDLEQIIRTELQNLPKEAKAELLNVLSAYEIALSSPKFLVPSKLAEAKGLAQILYVSHSQINDTETKNRLVKMEKSSDSMVDLMRLDATPSSIVSFGQRVLEDVSFLRKLMF